MSEAYDKVLDEAGQSEEGTMAKFDANKFKRDVQAAQRRAEAQVKRQIDEVNRKNQRAVDEHNRKVRRHNQQVVDQHNRRVEAHNRGVRAANTHNARLVSDLRQQLRSTSTGPRYTPAERSLADRVQDALVSRDERDWDVFWLF